MKKLKRSKIPFYNEKLQELKNGAESGFCRICNVFGKLTSDHVPPKSCGNKHKVVINVNGQTIISQNGLNCRTICSKCNNDLLGLDLDLQLKKVYDILYDFKKSGITLNNGKLQISVDAIKVARCLLGHYCSIELQEKGNIVEILSKPINDAGSITEKYRKFAHGDIRSIDNCRAYYWYYPFWDIKIIPYFAFTEDIRKASDSVIYGMLIKVFPIAMYFVDTSSSMRVPNASYIDLSTTRIVEEMIFKTDTIIPKNWPEVPLGYSLLAGDLGAFIDIKR